MPRESLPQPARSTMKAVLEATSARPGIDGQALLQAAITEARQARRTASLLVAL